MPRSRACLGVVMTTRAQGALGAFRTPLGLAIDASSYQNAFDTRLAAEATQGAT